MCLETKIYNVSSTTHAANHLTTVHDIERNNRGSKALARLPTNTIQGFFNRPSWNSSRFMSCLIEWVLRNRISFHVIETAPFRDLIESLRQEALEVLPKSSNTLRRSCLMRFRAARNSIKIGFTLAKSKIHISCDLWSSPNGHAFLGIVGSWWDYDDTLKSALIALPKLMGVHSGQNIAILIVDILIQYGIEEKLGYFMLDNATNNDLAVKAVNEELAERGFARDIEHEEARLRCTGHILNLVVKALLFGKDSDALEMDYVDLASWRKVGALGKLHNIVRFIRGSPQRRDRFLAVQTNDLFATEAFMLRLNNDTRWDSTYEMINCALKLRSAIDTFTVAAMNKRGGESQKSDRDQLAADRLHPGDWRELEDLHGLLKPFKTITMELQGNLSDARLNGAIFDVLPAFDFLLQHLEDAKMKFTYSPPLTSCINLAWKKLDNYYRRSDQSPVYVLAVLLDPRMKLQYFQRRWVLHQDWIDMAETKLQTTFAAYKDRLANMETAGNSTSGATGNGETDGLDSSQEDTALMSWKFEESAPTQDHFDEIALYLKSAVEPKSVDPRMWWVVNQSRFPILAAMARDIHSIPAMSSEVERVFSGYLPSFRTI